MIKIELTFGLKSRDNIIYSIDKANNFIQEYMIPVFDNMTITTGAGIWKGQVEPIFIVTIYLPDNDNKREKLDHICSEYCRLFNQECVLFTEFKTHSFYLLQEKPKLQLYSRFISMIDNKEYYVMEIKDNKIFITMITFNPMQDDPNLGGLIEWIHGSNYIIIKL